MKTELKKFYALIDEIEVAMMTTRRPDGHLESRAMANQKPAAGADLWFVTAYATGKVRDLETDPHINLAYYKDRTREWISVSGLATISRDREKIRELVRPRLEAVVWERGRSAAWYSWTIRGIVLIGVDIQAAAFLEVNKPRPVVLYELVKGWMTGDAPELGGTHTLEEPHRA